MELSFSNASNNSILVGEINSIYALENVIIFREKEAVFRNIKNTSSCNNYFLSSSSSLPFFEVPMPLIYFLGP